MTSCLCRHRNDIYEISTENCKCCKSIMEVVAKDTIGNAASIVKSEIVKASCPNCGTVFTVTRRG